MKIAMILTSTLFSLMAYAAQTFDFNFKNKEILDVITKYSQETGDKFVFAGDVTGTVTILLPKKVDKKEAFAALSEALKGNGYGIIKLNDHFEIRRAQQLTQEGIEVVTQLPDLQPVRFVTYFRAFKFANANEVEKILRGSVSSAGSIMLDKRKNAIMITDWTSNLARLEKIMSEMDTKAE